MLRIVGPIKAVQARAMGTHGGGGVVGGRGWEIWRDMGGPDEEQREGKDGAPPSKPPTPPKKKKQRWQSIGKKKNREP